ncbi:MAG TPA: response regulator [bacterium]|nr:response regulator [bacterium]
MKKKILLVDDVRLFLKLEETFFRRTGCEIFTAESGAQALEIARKSCPDLILLDYIMPDMMGDEVCKRLKTDEATRPIPVMIVSTSADQADIEKCFAAGCQDYVTKPINAQEMLAKAANILNIPNRVHYRIPLRFKVAGEVSGKSFSGSSRNLSRGGIMVECKDRITPLSEVTLDLPILPDNGLLTLGGRVVRTDRDEATESYCLGIQFHALAPGQKDALENFISQNEPPARTA